MNFQAASLMGHSIKQQDLPIMKPGNGAKPNRECGVNDFKITNTKGLPCPSSVLNSAKPSIFCTSVCMIYI